MQPHFLSFRGKGIPVFAVTVLLSFHAAAIDLLVLNNNNAGAGSLRQAIADNTSLGGGNTIVFSNTVMGTITLAGELVISNDVTIVGPGPDLLAVSGSNVSRIFRITNATVAISGLSIVNGRENASSGGGIRNEGTLLLNGCTVSNCFALFGGGIYSHQRATIVRSSIVNNQSPTYGGGFYGNGRLTNCTIAGNIASSNAVNAAGFDLEFGGPVFWSTTIAGNTGKGIESGGSPSALVGNSILAGNGGLDATGVFSSAGYNLVGKGEGAVGFIKVGDQVGTTASPLVANLRPLGFHGGPTPTMPPQSNSLAIDQGKSFGLANDQRSRARTFDNSGVFNATLGDGTDIGAVEAGAGMMVPVTTTNDAGPGSLRQAILHASSFEYDYIPFATNVTNTIRLTSGELVVDKALSIEGPGIHWFGAPGAWKLTLSGNNTNRVFRLSGGELSLFGLIIADGLATTGGGIRVEGGNHNIYHCQIVSNTASGGFGLGGGGLEITGNATVNLFACSVAHNQAGYSGGGIRQSGSNQLFVVNCTIASNRVTLPSNIGFFPHGGGIALSSGSLYIRQSTIASNTATFYGGGIANNFNPGTVSIYSSIVAGNSTPSNGPEVSGAVLSGGYNLVGNTNGSAGWGATGDQLGVNPLLGPLADYGGPTLTMALRAGSPAIDQGSSPSYFTDQRDVSRPLDDPGTPNASGGDGADIGAFEVDPNFRIVEFGRVGNDVALSLLTVLGRNYRAEYTNQLAAGTWTAFTNNVPGNGHLLWVTNHGGANEPQRFYRGAIVP